MTLKFTNALDKKGALQDWAINGITFEPEMVEAVAFNSTGAQIIIPTVLKKGPNTIYLPSMSLRSVGVFIDASEELLEAATNIKLKHLYVAANTTIIYPSIQVFMKEEATINHLADITIIKSTFK